MKKVFLAIAVASVFTACNNGETTEKTADTTVVKPVDTTKPVMADTTHKMSADTTKKGK